MTLYSIRLKGHVDPRWETLFEGFTVSHRFTADGQPITVMTGEVTDQSALYGLLARLRNLGANLISVAPEAGQRE